MIPQINTILYPTDLSDTSNHAFGYAASLANRYDASIVILHVLKAVTHSDVDLVTNVIGEKKWNEVLDRKKMEVVENIRKRLEDFCEQTRTEMSGYPFLVKNIKVEIGNPVDAIVEAAAKDDVDMVIMGARGHGAIAGTVIGSVSRRVVRRCKKPVLLVQMPDE